MFGELSGTYQFSDQFIALKNESIPGDILDVPVGSKTGQPQLRAIPTVVGHSHGYRQPAGSVTSVSVLCILLGPGDSPGSWPIVRVASVWPTEVHPLGSMGLCEKYPHPFCRSCSSLLGVLGHLSCSRVAPSGDTGEEPILISDLFLIYKEFRICQECFIVLLTSFFPLPVA